MVTTDVLFTEQGVNLSLVDRIFLLHTFMRGSEVATFASVTLINENFEELLEMFGVKLMMSVLEDFGEYFSSQRIVDVYEEVFDKYGIFGNSTLPLDFSRAIQIQRYLAGTFSYFKRVQDSFEEWVASRNGAEQITAITSVVLTLSAILVFIFN